MRNLVLSEEMNKSDSEDDPSMHSLCIENRGVVDLRQLLKDKISKNEIFCSFEVVSLKKPDTFYQRLLADMDQFSPLFYSLTWHNEAVLDSDSYLPLNVAKNFSGNTLLHLAAKSLKRNEVVDILKKIYTYGIMNIFVLQGDSLSEDGDFKYAADLVAFIREQFGDTFCVCVAGYPQMHPKSFSKELDLHYLKTKVEAGADFIITQIIFESKIFIDFVRDCREIGIEIPIIPGIFALTSYECLERMAKICKLDIPTKIKDDLAQIKDDAKAIKEYVIALTMQIIKDVIESGTACGFHLFTLNRLSLVEEICGRIDFRRRAI